MKTYLLETALASCATPNGVESML